MWIFPNYISTTFYTNTHTHTQNYNFYGLNKSQSMVSYILLVLKGSARGNQTNCPIIYIFKNIKRRFNLHCVNDVDLFFGLGLWVNFVWKSKYHRGKVNFFWSKGKSKLKTGAFWYLSQPISKWQCCEGLANLFHWTPQTLMCAIQFFLYIKKRYVCQWKLYLIVFRNS